MLNKPPPISFNLPKEAAYANRNVQEDPLNQPPDVALKQLEEEARVLKEEVAALKWLAKRKEQEWNSILGLLKKKEETWLRVKRQAELTMNDSGFQKIKALAGVKSTNDPTPSQVHKAVTTTIISNPNALTSAVVQPVQALNAAPVVNVASSASSDGSQRKVLIPVSQPLTPQAIQALSTQGLIKSSGMTPDGKRIIVVKKSGLSNAASGGPMVSVSGGPIKILPKNSGQPLNVASSIMNSNNQIKMTPIKLPVGMTGATKVVTANPKTVVTAVTNNSAVVPAKAVKLCAQCKNKPSKFECGGCSSIWYCSRECQEMNWDTHENECGTKVKKEIE